MSSQDTVTALGTDSFKEILGGKNDGLVLAHKLNEGKTKMIFAIQDSVGDKGNVRSDSHQSGRVLIYSKDRITAGMMLYLLRTYIVFVLKIFEYFSHKRILIFFTRK